MVEGKRYCLMNRFLIEPLRLTFICLLIGCGFCLASALAEPKQEEIIRLHLWGVRALAGEKNQEEYLAEGLQHLAEKLRSLPFTHFSILSNDEVAIPVYRKRTFQFARNQSVTVRPLELRNDMVCLWISWRDERGDKVLDTRIYIKRGDEMIAGTDSGRAQEGTVLVISAR